MRRTGRLAVVATTVLLAVGAVVLGTSAVTGLRSAGPVTMDAALAALAAGGAAVVLAWWSAGLAACALTAGRPGWRGRPTRAAAVARSLARSLPGPVRVLAAAALGVAVATTTAVTASAGPAPAAVGVPDPGWSATRPAPLPEPVRPGAAKTAAVALDPAAADPGWAPHRPPEPRRTPPAELVVDQPRAATVVADELVVRRGDTLWDICARHLPPDATDAEIAAEWPRWYDANQAVIGPDPDHIEPGQRLRPPGPPPVSRTT